MAIYRVVFHDQGEPRYGLHEVEFSDSGEIRRWNRKPACFSCDASDGQDGVAQLLMAAAAGSNGRTWRAYLSTQVEGQRGISARDRIGQGPWYNANGELIASDLDQLHISPNLVKRTAVDENGKLVNGRGDKPNRHDILTGSKDDGTAYFPWEKGDHTCGNWTSNDKGTASVGHHDRHGGGNISWTSAHATRGCSQADLESTGGAGLLYCFAAD